MRIYKTREDFDNLDLTNVFPGTICTIIDEAADPTYIFQNGQWNTFLTTVVDNVGDISAVYINGEVAPVPIYLLDSSGNVTGLKAPSGKLQQYVGIADRARMANGQPYGITKAVTNPGKLVARFVSSELTVNNGSPTKADHTGYDATGAVTGVPSMTGQPNVVKITPAADATEGVRFTTFATSVVTPQLVGGKIGLWLYVDKAPGYEAGGTPILSIAVVLTTEAGGSTTNALSVTWNANQVKEGWNFLTFVMRNPNAYVAGSGETEYHPYGLFATSLGTGADTDIVNNPLTKIIVQWVNAYDATTPCTIYLDSIWTGWETTPQVVLGLDDCQDDVINHVLPIFEQYGWVGYIATPARVWASGSKILANLSGASQYTKLVANGVQLRNAGWDCVNHSVNHLQNGTLTDAAEIAYEIKGVEPMYRAIGFTKGNEFYASPQSSTSRLAETVIATAGMKLQRHAFKANVSVTPWGVPNPNHLGASGVGSASAIAYTYVTSGASGSVTGFQIYSKIKIMADVIVAYGDTWFPFWHFVTTTGDSGSGEDFTGDNLYMTLSAFTKMCAYFRELELAGNLRVCRGMTGFYYGA